MAMAQGLIWVEGVWIFASALAGYGLATAYRVPSVWLMSMLMAAADRERHTHLKPPLYEPRI
jgi:hypothetical protein